MIDTNTPFSAVPPVEVPATPELPRAVPVVPTSEPVAKSKVGRPKLHANNAAKVAAHRQRVKEGTTQKQIAATEKAEASFDKKHPDPPTETAPEHPMRTGKGPAADKIFDAAMIVYRKKLAAFEKLWSDWLDADCDEDSPTNTHMLRGSVMKWAPSRTKGRLVTGEMDINQLDFIDAHGTLGSDTDSNAEPNQVFTQVSDGSGESDDTLPDEPDPESDDYADPNAGTDPEETYHRMDIEAGRPCEDLDCPYCVEDE